MTRRQFLCGWALVLSSLVLVPPGRAGVPDESRPWIAVGRQGMVASDSMYASQAGLEILRAGGNAIDAATATSFALAVTRPYSMGLGGGGFMLVRLGQTGEVFVLDYRECAPRAATADMFVKAREKLAQRTGPEGQERTSAPSAPAVPAPSRYGGLAVGVPGHIAGHAAMLERLGTRSFREVLAPAVRLAEQGFAVDEHYCSIARDSLAKMRDQPELRRIGQGLLKRLLFDGKAPAPGDVLRQPELADTLRQLQREGPSAFYRGTIGQTVVEAVQSAGGILTTEDLSTYRPVWRTPLRIRYRERYELLLMPPPSSGGICVAETLNILENWDLAAVRRRDPSLAAHLTVEALKHAFADRARHLGDADFAPVPVAQLTSKAYAKELAGRIRDTAVSPAAAYGSPPDDSGTSHFCVADRWGNVVSCTETINTGFGSLVVAEPAGIVLNNEMDDFTAEPGKPNAFGLSQSDHNAVVPGKRPLSCMTPTIVLRDGRPVLAVGASGGPIIITATLQVILAVVEYGQPLADAIEGPRFHHQWDPNILYYNQFPADGPLVRGLKARGHELSDRRREAVVQALQIEDDTLTGASDPRKGGRPAGY
ncbi:MAG: gamma-glutamyltransferase [Phycisphaerae bacterium]|nr:gamma-glutamyltransferase [Phycisphaerae bacterium]